MPTPIGPNVRKLISKRAADFAIEKAIQRHGNADVGTVAQGIIDGTLQVCLREAAAWVTATLALLRQAPGSEQWPTDEDMAGELLGRLYEAKK